MMRVSPARYFLTARIHAPYALLILAIVLITGVYIVTLNPYTGLDDGLGMVLFVQMFLASTGFSARARRGHFDALLTVSESRTHALVAHWVVSVAPGVLAWGMVALVGLALGNGAAWSALIGPRAAALFIVSAVAWTLGFAMARGTAGFLWTMALFATLVRRADLATSISPVVLLFCPFALMRSGPVESAPVVAAVLLAFVALLFTWRHAEVLDVYLLEQA